MINPVCPSARSRIIAMSLSVGAPASVQTPSHVAERTIRFLNVMPASVCVSKRFMRILTVNSDRSEHHMLNPPVISRGT
jgi:hypothetical protein